MIFVPKDLYLALYTEKTTKLMWWGLSLSSMSIIAVLVDQLWPCRMALVRELGFFAVLDSQEASNNYSYTPLTHSVPDLISPNHAIRMSLK